MRQALLSPIVCISILLTWPSFAEAKPPPPAPRVFINYALDTACADGSTVRAKMTEWFGFLWLHRQECRRRLPTPISRQMPSGGNAIETDFLIYGGRIFEEALRGDPHTILLCRSEINGKTTSNGVKVIVQRVSEDNFVLSLSESPSFHWSAVEATLTETTYAGVGNMNPEEFINLSVDTSGTRAKVEYLFEIGTGRIGEREKTHGTFDSLHCYKP